MSLTITLATIFGNISHIALQAGDYLPAHPQSHQKSIGVNRARRVATCSSTQLLALYASVGNLLSDCENEAGGTGGFDPANFEDHCNGPCYNLAIAATQKVIEENCEVDLGVLKQNLLVPKSIKDEISTLQAIGLDKFSPAEMAQAQNYIVTGCAPAAFPGYNGTCVGYAQNINSTANATLHNTVCHAFSTNSPEAQFCNCWIANGTTLYNEVFTHAPMCAPNYTMSPTQQPYADLCNPLNDTVLLDTMSQKCDLATYMTYLDCSSYNPTMPPGTNNNNNSSNNNNGNGESSKHKAMITVVASLGSVGGLIVLLLTARFAHDRYGKRYQPVGIYNFDDNDQDTEMMQTGDADGAVDGGDDDDVLMSIARDPAVGAAMPALELQAGYHDDNLADESITDDNSL